MTEIAELTDRVAFRSYADVVQGQRLHQWAGQWPPPEHLTIITHTPSGQVKIVEPDKQTPASMDEIRANSNYLVERYRRNRASKRPEPAKPEDDWYRLAEYVPIPPLMVDVWAAIKPYGLERCRQCGRNDRLKMPRAVKIAGEDLVVIACGCRRQHLCKPLGA